MTFWRWMETSNFNSQYFEFKKYFRELITMDLIRSWETTHLPLPWVNINLTSHLRQNFGLGEGWVGSFPETYNPWQYWSPPPRPLQVLSLTYYKCTSYVHGANFLQINFPQRVAINTEKKKWKFSYRQSTRKKILQAKNPNPSITFLSVRP